MSITSAEENQSHKEDGARHALWVALGILLSRLFGLVRQRVFAHFLGNSIAAAAFSAALRIPNYLQNLLGEGVLSASFIPVYAKLLAKKDTQAANQLASAVLGMLALLTSLLVALGMVFSAELVDVIAPKLSASTRSLAIELVRIIFPGTGLLVFSAWCLGVLNSHRKFFLSYAAPVVWNGAIIAALLFFGPRSPQDDLAKWVAWGVVVGSALQLIVQLPTVFSVLGWVKPTFRFRFPPFVDVTKSFGPVVMGRGVVQISSYLDLFFASFLSERIISTLTYAQSLYLLPVSLFGMSVSAAELPAMSQMAERHEKLLARLSSGLERLAFFVVPSAFAMFFLGDVICATLLQTGAFTANDSLDVWILLAGLALGLTSTTAARLYASTFYALQDTRTPFYIALLRVFLGAGLAAVAVFGAGKAQPFEFPSGFSALGLALASSASACFEWFLLKMVLARRIGQHKTQMKKIAALVTSAVWATFWAFACKSTLIEVFGAHPAVSQVKLPHVLWAPNLAPWMSGAAVLTVFCGAYAGAAYILKVPLARGLAGKWLGKIAKK